MRNLWIAAAFLFSISLAVYTQEAPKHYVIGVEILGSSKAGCPVFIGRVGKNSPAARVGIKAGDRLLAVDESAVSNPGDASKRLGSTAPGRVAIQLLRDDKPYAITVKREEREALWRENGMKVTSDGNLVEVNSTDAEIRQRMGILQALEREQDRITVFPGHYPADKHLYYPGFEVFVWDKGHQITVGGIEDGPAKRSGVRWGDPILSVNGVDPHGKSVAELEALFSSRKSAPMALIVDRAGVRATFSFDLEQASAVLHDNSLQMVDGWMVPLWAPERYVYCFEE